MKWWGYIHENGSIQVKRVFIMYEDDLRDAKNSPFVKEVFPAFEADGRDEAIYYIKGMVAGRGRTLTPLEEVLAAGELLAEEITRLAREYKDRSVELDICFATRNWYNVKMKYRGES